MHLEFSASFAASDIRIGVSVVAPLTKSCYAKFRGGQYEDMDISNKDILVRSNYLLIDAVVEDEAEDWRREKSKRTLSQSMTTLFQLASLCLPLKQSAVDPFVLSFCGTAESARRLRAYDYVEVGAKTPVTHKDIMEFRNADEYLAAFRFGIMRTLLRAYQQASNALE